MFVLCSWEMNTIEHINSEAQPPFGERGEAIASAQLDDLARLRAAAMAMAERLAAPDDVVASTPTTPTIEQRALAFTRVARAVRQIIVLEQEMLGLRAYSPRQFPTSKEQRSEPQHDLVSILAAIEDSGDEYSSETDMRDANDVRDRNDLRDPDDLDDYDDYRDAGMGDTVMDDGRSAPRTASAPSSAAQPAASAVMPYGEPSASDAPVQYGRPTASSAMPHIPIRRRAMRGRGPPDG